MGTYFFLSAVRTRNVLTVERALVEAAERGGYAVSGTKAKDVEDWISFPPQRGEWTCAQFQGAAVDWKRATLEAGTRVKAPAFFFEIHDGDAWGYHFFEKGEEVAKFVSIPSVHEDAAEDPEAWSGNVRELVARLGLSKAADLEKYLVHQDPENPSSEKANPQDQFELSDPWVVADFTEKLGILWEDKESVGSMLYLVRKG